MKREASSEIIQLFNTAIVKSKEKLIDENYEERLTKACKSPALTALDKAVELLSEAEGLSRDQAAISVIETIRELDNIWNDYISMEGIGQLRELLKGSGSKPSSSSYGDGDDPISWN